LASGARHCLRTNDLQMEIILHGQAAADGRAKWKHEIRQAGQFSDVSAPDRFANYENEQEQRFRFCLSQTEALKFLSSS
jgi:hypothetical protein